MKTCVVQYADREYVQLLELTRKTHIDHCARLGYSYVSSTSPLTDRHPYWEKAALIRVVLKAGYEHIIWLDADTVWNGEPFPLPETVFGLTWHTPPAEPHHFNAGMMIINNRGGQAVEPVNQWWNTSDEGHKWGDQWALNRLIQQRPELVSTLDHRWNSVVYIPSYVAPEPAVLAWHGMGGNCLSQMRAAVRMAGYGH